MKQRRRHPERERERENFPNSGTRLWEQLLFMIAMYIQIHVRLPCKFSPIWRIYLYIRIHKSRTKESLILERNWSSVMQRRVRENEREKEREWKHPRLSSLYPRWAYRITISSNRSKPPDSFIASVGTLRTRESNDGSS